MNGYRSMTRSRYVGFFLLVCFRGDSEQVPESGIGILPRKLDSAIATKPMVHVSPVNVNLVYK